MARLEIDETEYPFSNLFEKSPEELNKEANLAERIKAEAMQKVVAEQRAREKAEEEAKENARQTQLVKAKAFEEARKKKTRLAGFIVTLAAVVLIIAVVLCVKYFKIPEFTSSELLAGDNVQLVNGMYVVDMGVSVLWGCSNLGANDPNQVGDSYGFGYTSPGKHDDKEVWPKKKYNDTELPISMDPACCLGKGWRTPSESEFDELIKNSVLKKAICDGVEGIIVKSKNNGALLFIPQLPDSYNDGWRYMSRTTPDTDFYYFSTRVLTDSPEDDPTKWVVDYELVDKSIEKKAMAKYYCHKIRPVHSK